LSRSPCRLVGSTTSQDQSNVNFANHSTDAFNIRLGLASYTASPALCPGESRVNRSGETHLRSPIRRNLRHGVKCQTPRRQSMSSAVHVRFGQPFKLATPNIGGAARLRAPDCRHRSKEQLPTPTHATLGSALLAGISRCDVTAPSCGGWRRALGRRATTQEVLPKDHVPVDAPLSLAKQQHTSPTI
jgi:hypothetical protein